MRNSFRDFMLKLDRLGELTVSTTYFVVDLLRVTTLISCQNDIKRHAKRSEGNSTPIIFNHPFMDHRKNNGVFLWFGKFVHKRRVVEFSDGCIVLVMFEELCPLFCRKKLLLNFMDF
jgi:hypothetical protein